MLRRGLVAVLFVALPLVSGCSDVDGDEGPSASVTTASSRPSTTSSSVALTPEQEVEAAYLRSWDVYAKAVRELDPAGLEESYTGDGLVLVREDLDKYIRSNTPVAVRVDHNLQLRVVDERTAIVIDEYVNHSVLLNAQGEPVEPDPNETLTEIYTLVKEDGRWKVAGIERR